MCLKVKVSWLSVRPMYGKFVSNKKYKTRRISNQSTDKVPKLFFSSSRAFQLEWPIRTQEQWPKLIVEVKSTLLQWQLNNYL